MTNDDEIRLRVFSITSTAPVPSRATTLTKPRRFNGGLSTLSRGGDQISQLPVMLIAA